MRTKKTKNKRVKIRCPKCGHVQKAWIEKTTPFYIYIHTCEKCRYTTTESDWEEVK